MGFFKTIPKDIEEQAMIVEERHAKRPEAIGAVGNPADGDQREQPRMHELGGEPAIERHVAEIAARQVARALHEIGLPRHDRLDQTRNFVRPVLVVPRHDDDDVEAFALRHADDGPDGRADAALMAWYAAAG